MKFLPYARLMRLPNVFSAMADIALCIFMASAYFNSNREEFVKGSILLFIASALLYISGMVWNDVCDVDIDRRERPFRPIPSGQIPLISAEYLAIITMGFGLLFAAWADEPYHYFSRGWLTNYVSFPIAVVLCCYILAYNGVIKHTIVGPLCMAMCRFLNIMLGLSFVPHTAMPNDIRLHLAATTAIYILGVTIFAKQEASTSSRGGLIIGAAIILLAVVGSLTLEYHMRGEIELNPFPVLLSLFLTAIGIPLIRAIRTPSPVNVQAAVKRCILGLIAFDAILATVFVGWAGLSVALLLIPALVLGKWIYST